MRKILVFLIATFLCGIIMYFFLNFIGTLAAICAFGGGGKSFPCGQLTYLNHLDIFSDSNNIALKLISKYISAFLITVLPGFLVAFLILNKFFIKDSTTNKRFKFSNLLLAFIATVIPIMVIYGPAMIGSYKSMKKDSERQVFINQGIKSISKNSIIEKPRFTVQDISDETGKQLNFGRFNFVIEVPIQINQGFTYDQLHNTYSLRFTSLQGKNLMGDRIIIPNCQYGTPDASLEIPNVNRKNVSSEEDPMNSRGRYSLVFRYNYAGQNCSRESFRSLIGEQIGLFRAAHNGNPSELLNTFTIDAIY